MISLGMIKSKKKILKYRKFNKLSVLFNCGTKFTESANRLMNSENNSFINDDFIPLFSNFRFLMIRPYIIFSAFYIPKLQILDMRAIPSISIKLKGFMQMDVKITPIE